MEWFLVSFETNESNHCDMMVRSFKTKAKRWCLLTIFAWRILSSSTLSSLLSACAFSPSTKRVEIWEFVMISLHYFLQKKMKNYFLLSCCTRKSLKFFSHSNMQTICMYNLQCKPNRFIEISLHFDLQKNY